MNEKSIKQSFKLHDFYTPLYYWNRDSLKRYRVNQGGTSSSKTWSIMQLLTNIAVKKKTRITVVAQTADSLERGALRDFKEQLKLSDNLKLFIKDPDLVRGPYQFLNGSVMEFKNLKDGASARHGKRDILFLNEANSINYEAASQLMVRTSETIFIDYNSDARFWVHKEIIPRKNCDLFISNYKHNSYCPAQVIEELLEYKKKWETSGNLVLRQVFEESRTKADFKAWDKTSNKYWKNKWYVYGIGLTGVTEGAIFEEVFYRNLLPLGLKKVAYAMDWGFTNDPTTLLKAGMRRGKIFAKELLYETHLTTPDVIAKFKKLGINKKDLIIADNSNLDAIQQIRNAGYNMVPAKKGPGSVKGGINALLGHEIHLTNDSKNWQVEQENYKWKKNKGEWTNDPIDDYNHLWDGLRYWYQHFHKPAKKNSRARQQRRVRKVR